MLVNNWRHLCRSPHLEYTEDDNVNVSESFNPLDFGRYQLSLLLGLLIRQKLDAAVGDRTWRDCIKLNTPVPRRFKHQNPSYLQTYVVFCQARDRET